MPSARVIVPRSAAIAPPDATGVPFATTGGHTWAQEPEQLDCPLLSAAHRYSARPDAPTRYVPCAPFTALIAIPVAAAAVEVLEDVLVAAGLAPELELLLPHAASSSATPTRVPAPTARNFAVLELAIILLPLRGFMWPFSPATSTNKDARAAQILPLGLRCGSTSDTV